MVVGITGSIGSGKSIVSKYLEEKGYKLVDADKIAYRVFNENIKSIKKLFPNAFIDDKIDRKQIAFEIFNCPMLKVKLEKIIHPRVLKTIKIEIKKNKKKIMFLDIPLLYETKYEKMCDKVIVVYITLEKQIERLMARDKIDREYALKKINSQISMEEKKKRADYVVDNSFTIQQTYLQLEEIFGDDKMKFLDYFSNDFETTDDNYITTLKTRYYRARSEEVKEKIKQLIAQEKGIIKSESENYREIFYETPKYSAVIMYVSPRINETAIDIKITTYRMFGLGGPGKKIIERLYQELDKMLPFKGIGFYK